MWDPPTLLHSNMTDWIIKSSYYDPFKWGSDARTHTQQPFTAPSALSSRTHAALECLAFKLMHSDAIMHAFCSRMFSPPEHVTCKSVHADPLITTQRVTLDITAGGAHTVLRVWSFIRVRVRLSRSTVLLTPTDCLSHLCRACVPSAHRETWHCTTKHCYRSHEITRSDLNWRCMCLRVAQIIHISSRHSFMCF